MDERIKFAKSWNFKSIYNISLCVISERHKNLFYIFPPLSANRNKNSPEKENARTYRLAHSRSVHAREFFFTPVREVPDKRERASVCGKRNLTREHRRQRAITPLTLRGPFDQYTLSPQCEKPFFPPDAHRRARARTHRRRRRRRIVAEFTRARESPLRRRLKIRNAGASTSKNGGSTITREAVHSAPSSGCRRSRE